MGEECNFVFHVTIGRDRVDIDARVFKRLLANAWHLHELKVYKTALSKRSVSLSDLKDLATRNSVPYPLFFAPLQLVNKQIVDEQRTLSSKIPSKKEMSVGLRGNIKSESFDLIFRDLSRKQGFLRRILAAESDCDYVGSVRKINKKGGGKEEMAAWVREYFDINVDDLRTMPKAKVLAFLCSKFEKKGILISFSSHNYMPQKIDSKSRISGFCIKDKKFPYIFINTRDGDSQPSILETDGRQIFTLVHMIVCIGLDLFALNTASRKLKKGPYKTALSVTGEVLVPSELLVGVHVKTIDDIREYAQIFKVTPSMMVMRLREERKINPAAARAYFELLKAELDGIESQHKRSPSPVTGYKKYNGERLSREVLNAYKERRIPFEDAANILFRKGKMKNDLFPGYQAAFNIS